MLERLAGMASIRVLSFEYIMHYQKSNHSYINRFCEREIPGLIGKCYQCEFSTEHYSDSAAYDLLEMELPESLDQAVVKRKAEFVAGRFVAQRALTALGATDLAIRIGANRAPVWPESYTGSISHSQKIAISAVANRDYAKSIGLDVESMLGEKIAKNIVDSILVESEKKFLRLSVYTAPTMVTLIFSAKESLFKALYHEVGCYFDYNAVRLVDIDFHKGEFVVELMQDLTSDLRFGSCFEGVFELDKHSVLTAIIYTN